MLSNLWKIGDSLYMTDFAETDLIKFWKLTMDEDVAKGINDGAKMMKASSMVLVKIEPKQWGAPARLPPEIRQFEWTF